MKISTVSIAKLSEEKKSIPVIATGKAYAKDASKITKREKAIRDAFADFSVGTRKTSSELVRAIHSGAEWLKYSDAVTDREILNTAKSLQADGAYIIARVNKKGEYFYERTQAEAMRELDIALAVVSIEEQEKANAERKAKRDAQKKAERAAMREELLAELGQNEAEILGDAINRARTA